MIQLPQLQNHTFNIQLRRCWYELHKLLNPRTQLAAFTLVAMLQKAPVIARVFNAAKFAIEPATRILQRIVVTAASIGSIRAVSGATEFVLVPEPPLNLKVGESFQFGFGIRDTPETADSWLVEGTIPPGLLVRGRGGEIPNGDGVFNSNSGSVSGIPTEAGVFQLSLKPFNSPNATGDTTDAINVTFTVTSDITNGAPSVSSAIGDQTIRVSRIFNLDISNHFLDPDEEDTLSFSAEGPQNADLPDWLLFNGSTGVLSGTPAQGDIGELTVIVTASDGKESVQDTFAISVLEQVIAEPTTISFRKVAQDIEFEWPINSEQGYQLETSSDGVEWTPDFRGVTEGLDKSSVRFSVDEITTPLLVRVSTQVGE